MPKNSRSVQIWQISVGCLLSYVQAYPPAQGLVRNAFRADMTLEHRTDASHRNTKRTDVHVYILDLVSLEIWHTTVVLCTKFSDNTCLDSNTWCG